MCVAGRRARGWEAGSAGCLGARVVKGLSGAVRGCQNNGLSTALWSHSRPAASSDPREAPECLPTFSGKGAATKEHCGNQPRQAVASSPATRWRRKEDEEGKRLKTNLFRWLPFSPAFPGQTDQTATCFSAAQAIEPKPPVCHLMS